MAQAGNQEHIFHLSSIDQSFARVYIRYSLSFACDEKNANEITSRLNATVKRAVSHLPILAGVVRPQTGNGVPLQQNRLEVAVTLNGLASFAPSTKQLTKEEFGYTYEELTKARMPPSALINEHLTPLPDTPDPQGSPVFAVQANFIAGGMIVALYLHHSVADMIGLRTIIRHMSTDLPTRRLFDDDLKDDAKEQDKLRDRLSGSRSAKSDLVNNARPATGLQTIEQAMTSMTLVPSGGISHIICFNLNLIEETKNLLNERFHYVYNDRMVLLSAFDVLTAVLWKAVNRARLRISPPLENEGPERTSTVIVPVNIRKRVEPPLDDSHFGNAAMHALATAGIMRLAMPYDASGLAYTARLIRTGIASVAEERVRSAIAGINESNNVQSAPIKQANFETDLIVTSWADLLLENAELNLGLGKPDWGRKLSRGQTARGCIVHPVRKEEGLWEVMVQLSKEEMDSLLQDENFMSFVVYVV